MLMKSSVKHEGSDMRTKLLKGAKWRAQKLGRRKISHGTPKMEWGWKKIRTGRTLTSPEFQVHAGVFEMASPFTSVSGL